MIRTAGICSVILAMIVCAFNPDLVRAGNDVVFGLSAGGGHVPSDDWRSAGTGLSASRIEESTYSSESLSPFVEASLAFVFRKKNVIRLSVEYITTEANLSSTFFVDNPSSAATTLVHWNFSTTPINVSYEAYLLGYDRFSPFIGLGGGYYFSTVEWRRLLENPIVGSMKSGGTGDGEGFGMHVYFGFRGIVWQHLGLNSKIRFRYADGMAFTDRDGALSLEFTGVDVSFGMDVRL
jgi:hypothetical protein